MLIISIWLTSIESISIEKNKLRGSIASFIIRYTMGTKMPFKSEAQKKWMFANKPKMAKEWANVTPKGKKLPKRVTKKKVKK